VICKGVNMTKKKFYKIALFLIMILIALICLLPFYFMLIMSTQYTEDIYKGITFLPGRYLLENLKTVMNAHFEVYYKNSLIVAASATALSLIVSTMCGFSFAMYNFKGSKFLFAFVLVTMMIPTQLGLVAFVVEMKAIGWMNTLLPLIVPPAATGFGVYWMKNFIGSNFPKELMDSARIDGASEPGILFSIAVPCIKPAIASLGLMNFVTNWNSFLVPLIVLNKSETYTVPIGIINLNSAYRNDLAAKITALSIGIIPLLILFLLTAKTFISGITMGAVKE
jgi:ABC-type glycerol-3-phosphate transport system permease component